MDQPKSDKFAELSPVLELVYVMLTNMAKYMDVYASDIEADKTEQYVEAKGALKTAIAKFDVLYGLKSPSSEVEVAPIVEDASVPFADAEVAETTPAVESAEQPYDFASGNDPESLKKAKQAVEELKTLFADMKMQESEVAAQAQVVEPMVATQEVVSQPTEAALPTFVAPPSPVQPMAAEVPVQTVETLPTPMNTPAPTQDASEIDSILAELKKLQNKGTPQL